MEVFMSFIKCQQESENSFYLKDQKNKIRKGAMQDWGGGELEVRLSFWSLDLSIVWLLVNWSIFA